VTSTPGQHRRAANWRGASWAIALSVLLAACATVPRWAEYPKTASHAIERPETTPLGRALDATLRANEGKSGLRLLPAAQDGFLVRAQLIGAATRAIDLQYYIFREDVTGQILTDAIVRAADRGVRVRMLLDDAATPPSSVQVAALDAHPNIEVRMFNPFSYRGGMVFVRGIEFLFDAPRLNRRMHNKLFVVDNAAALVGGRNIGDEYFAASTQFEFGDYDVFAAGPVVKELSASFDHFWNSALSVPVAALAPSRRSHEALDSHREDLRAHRNQPANGEYTRRVASGEPLGGMLSGKTPLTWAHAKVLYDPPEKAEGENDATSAIEVLLEGVTQTVSSELLIVSPYFVPKNAMGRFKALRERGVQVRVLTNSLDSTDVLIAHAGYARYRMALLKEGIELFEVRPVLGNPKGSGSGSMPGDSAGRFSLHAKVMVFDRKKVFVGSLNVDPRAEYFNTEIGLLIDSPALARQVASRFESIARPANSYVVRLRDDESGAPKLVWRTEFDGRAVELEREPAASELQRAKLNFYSLLQMDDQL
jgi:putative cardiolipin synthase